MSDTVYHIHPEVRFDHLDVIDIPQLVDQTQEKWVNYSLSEVNDHLIRLGILEGEFHWHQHDEDDEYFHVLEGQLLIDIEGRTIELNAGQAVTIPKGLPHRPRAPKKCVVLMVESNKIQPKGD